MSARPRYLILCILILTLSTLGRAQTSAGLDCAACHADKAQALKTSAHAGLSCTTCHVGIKTFPHPKGIALPKCSQCHATQAHEWARSIHGLEFNSGNKAAPNCQVCHGDAHQLKRTKTWAFKKSIPQLCGACHLKPFTHYEASVHGQAIQHGVTQAPVCTSCHTAHQIQPPTVPTSTVYPTHVPNTCGKCHGNVMMEREFNIPPARLTSYEASFHGLALKEGNLTAADCASCHGVHLILPASNPRSTINPKNLPKTCGKCHPDAGIRFAITPVHVLPGMGEPLSVGIVRDFYLIIIPLLIGLMFVHNLGDWIRKVIDLRLRRITQANLPPFRRSTEPRAEMSPIRMYRFERLEHYLLLGSFLTLAWTGFCFHWPHAWFAAPFSGVVWGWRVRGIVHRVFAVIFMATGVMHVISLVKDRKLRLHWKLLWPVRNDVPEAADNFAYNLGLRHRRPRRSAHSYIEKAEYWALIWGTVLMSITGLMLWGRNWVLRWLPMLSLQLASNIHFYEAVLATLAIVVWHFYSVIFDPEVYPMDPAWLTGHGVSRSQNELLGPAAEAEEEDEKEEEEEVDKQHKEEGKQGQKRPGNSGPPEEENSKDG